MEVVCETIEREEIPAPEEIRFEGYSELFNETLKGYWGGQRKSRGFLFEKGLIKTEDEHADLLHLSMRLEEPESPPKAQILIQHGLGEHQEFYYEFGLLWAQKGLVVHFVDWRGFGHSGGARMQKTVYDNQYDVVHILRELEDDLPLFLYGHSMGGCILTSFMLNNPHLNVAGLILSAPPLSMNQVLPGPLKLLAVHGLHALKDFVFTSKINPMAISRHSRIFREFSEDPYVVPVIGGPQIQALSQTMYALKYNAQYMKTPTYLNLGVDDTVVCNKGGKEFYERMKCEKKLTEYEGAKHELHVDAGKDLFENTLAWVEEQLAKPGVKKLGTVVGQKFRVGPLKKKEPLQHKGKLTILAILFYYFIGYLLMRSKIIYKNPSGNQLISWPYALYRRFRG